MRFDTGFWDRIFGKRQMMDVPLRNGSMRRVRVTENWFNKMVAEGAFKPSEPNRVHVHVVGTLGSSLESALVGEDIEQQEYARLRHPETGALYALRFFEAGEQKTSFVTKAVWDEAVKRLGLL